MNTFHRATIGDYMMKSSTVPSQTMHLLMMEYGGRALIPLDELAEKLLGLSIDTAKRRAGLCDLPFAAVRYGNSQKSPYLVHLQDLANYIESICSVARNEWCKMQGC
jgi:hypothetical protein